MPLVILFIVIVVGTVLRYAFRPRVTINVINVVPSAIDQNFIHANHTGEFISEEGTPISKADEQAGKEAIFQLFDQFPNGICFKSMPQYHDEYLESRAPIENDLPDGITLSK